MPFISSISPTRALSVESTNCTASPGPPASTRLSRTMDARSRFDRMASLPPLSSTAFPDFRQRQEMSMVTLGRLSYIAPISPSGTRRLPYLQPVRQRPHVEGLPDGIGQAGDALHVLGEGPDAVGGEEQPVQQRLRKPRLRAGVIVLPVRLDDLVLPVQQPPRNVPQGLVLQRTARPTQLPPRPPPRQRLGPEVLFNRGGHSDTYYQTSTFEGQEGVPVRVGTPPTSGDRFPLKGWG